VKRRQISFGRILSIILMIMFLIYIPYSMLDDIDSNESNYTFLIEQLENKNVSEIYENPPFVLFSLKDNNRVFKTKMLTNRIAEDSAIMKMVKDNRVSIDVAKESSLGNIVLWILSFLPTIVLMLIIYFFISKAKIPGAGFKRLDDKNIGKREKKRYTFSDVAGLTEAKQDLIEVVEFLKTPYKFKKLGARIPKGLLLIGVPGTGKTLLAKAVAGEAGVPFFSVAGSEFSEMFAGVGSYRVRELFNKAKNNAPCIIFIDEIDSIAKQRQNGGTGVSEDREQTLNQLLVEMDGFTENQNVIVIAATNRADVLDKAILRPGRFDRHVNVDIPTLQERKDILKVHAKNKPFEEMVDLEVIAKKSSGLVGADLENILNEAAIIAARENRDKITSKNLEDALDRVFAGPERKSKVMSSKEREIVAYHEAGHALVAHMLPNTQPIHKISIIPRGSSALGFTMQLPQEDKFLWSYEDFINEIKILMGGRAAEKIIFSEITSGASNDIEKATKIAKNMISKYGMSSKFGPQAFGEQQRMFDYNPNALDRSYSNETALIIDDEIKNTILNCYRESEDLLNKNIESLKKIALYLLENEIIFEDEISDIISKI